MSFFDQIKILTSYENDGMVTKEYEGIQAINGAPVIFSFPVKDQPLHISRLNLHINTFVYEHLNLPVVAEIHSKNFPLAIEIKDGEVKTLVMVYGNKDLVMIYSDLVMADPEIEHKFIDCIWGFIKKHNLKALITFNSMENMSEEEEEENDDEEKEHEKPKDGAIEKSSYQKHLSNCPLIVKNSLVDLDNIEEMVFEALEEKTKEFLCSDFVTVKKFQDFIRSPDLIKKLGLDGGFNPNNGSNNKKRPRKSESKAIELKGASKSKKQKSSAVTAACSSKEKSNDDKYEVSSSNSSNDDFGMKKKKKKNDLVMAISNCPELKPLFESEKISPCSKLTLQSFNASVICKARSDVIPFVSVIAQVGDTSVGLKYGHNLLDIVNKLLKHFKSEAQMDLNELEKYLNETDKEISDFTELLTNTQDLSNNNKEKTKKHHDYYM